jgi:D-3-phosphoglycerate dehydrogenase
MAFMVAVTDSVFPSQEPEHRVLDPLGVELRAGQCRSEEEVIALAKDADAILNCYAKMTARVIGELKRCKVIARYGIGVDNVDLAAATRAGIVVTNVPDYCVDEVSDHGLALLLGLARRVVAADQAVKGGAWDVVAHKGIRRVRGQTLGLLGFGKIARALAGKAQAIGMQVVAVDPFVDAGAMARLQVRAVDLDTLLAESDAVSVHVPLSPETRGIIGERALARMKPTAFLINTSRGPVVDESALIAALQAGRLAGAGLDVFEQEPVDPESPLLKMENVVTLPHIGSATEATRQAMVDLAADNLLAVLQGKPPLTPVNPEVLDRRRR